MKTFSGTFKMGEGKERKKKRKCTDVRRGRNQALCNFHIWVLLLLLTKYVGTVET